MFLLIFFAHLAGATAATATLLHFGGVPVELTISEVSKQTLRFELAPLDEHGKAKPSAPSGVLVPISAKPALRIRELSGERQMRIGGLRVTVQAEPLVVTVRRADDSLVQELVFSESAATNLISFRTAGPVLGLGEGGDQFDRRGNNFPLINGQVYRRRNSARASSRLF